MTIGRSNIKMQLTDKLKNKVTKKKKKKIKKKKIMRT
jgi:hypothetical protein